ncbi:fimbria/pilus outer membrane usher protein [Diaphorobacter aerolatus]|uniref:Fimbrial biogenesis outer membrane usher protein n=1 Tax=Diaphorobacter aerolatus TaxID=1288495 RepID=A0A7H0GP46_9BURK|nr:fimbria/pilus outer membrane usher protein [Diaphorobacter aerolatus]QNP50062.1 fimbrial biogenesis outer membrane usher protein [Diaphorobacter aerolatus]
MTPAQLRNGSVWMLRETLTAMGVKREALPTGSGSDADWVLLNAIPAAVVDFNAGRQTLVLTLPFEALNWTSTDINTDRRTTPVPTSSSGMLVNYDLYGWAGDQSRSLNASTEFRAFRENSVISNTMLSRYQDHSNPSGSAMAPSSFRNVRLDTTYSRSWQDDLLTLRIGDTLTGALPWSRATRIGGIQLARNFGLQPYASTAPLPALMGTSAMPSDVALYINGLQQYQGKVPAGPFSLNAIPGMTGSGNAQVVLTDALGRATTLQFSFYQANQLLKKGLSDWSAELGWVRKDYGNSSFNYGSDPMTSGTWRYGVTDGLTLQSHAEVTPKLVNAGGGASWLVGDLGVISAAAAGSRLEGQSGSLARLDYNWSNQRFNVNVSGTRASEQYRDAASLYEDTRLASSGNAFVGYSHPSWGSLNLGMVYLRNHGDTEAQRYATGSWSRSMGSRAYVSVNLNHNLDDSKKSNVQLLFNWYLDGRLNLGSTLSHQDGKTQLAATAHQRAPSEGGWGWRTGAQAGNGGSGFAQVDYVGRSFEANAAVSRTSGNTSGALGASGALVLMDGHTFASRRIFDGFAVVSTNGVPGVPVKRENIVVGETNDKGVMLVPQLGAYRDNKISIDAMSLPARMRVPDVNRMVAPTDRSGVLVKFDLSIARSATVVLHGSDRRPLPIGSIVIATNAQSKSTDNADRQNSVVGYDGATFFDALQERNRLTAYLPNGSSCTANLDWPGAKPTEVPTIGPLVCRP